MTPSEPILSPGYLQSRLIFTPLLRLRKVKKRLLTVYFSGFFTDLIELSGIPLELQIYWQNRLATCKCRDIQQ